MYPNRYRVQSKEVKARAANRKDDPEDSFEQLCLQEAEYRAASGGREKHLYSFLTAKWCSKSSAYSIMDIYAFRVIVNDLTPVIACAGARCTPVQASKPAAQTISPFQKRICHQSLYTSIYPHGVPAGGPVIRTEDMDRWRRWVLPRTGP